MAKEASLVNQCLDILKREDVKSDLKLLLKPVMEFILFEIRPYTYIIILLLFMIFIMILANLIILLLLLRNKCLITKLP